MRIFLDTCIYGGVKQRLISAGYDVIWSGDWPEDPGDEEILGLAYQEKRILITFAR